MTKDKALTLAAEMERGQFSTTLLPAAAELRRLHEENQKLRAQLALERKAENARELGLDYEPAGHGGRPMTLRECMEAEEPEQEPKCGAIIEVFGKDWRLEYLSLPVGKHKLYTQQYTYTAPPQRKPLTDEEITDAVRDAGLDWHYAWTLSDEESSRLTKFARAIEAAHGIKENT